MKHLSKVALVTLLISGAIPAAFADSYDANYSAQQSPSATISANQLTDAQAPQAVNTQASDESINNKPMKDNGEDSDNNPHKNGFYLNAAAGLSFANWNSAIGSSNSFWQSAAAAGKPKSSSAGLWSSKEYAFRGAAGYDFADYFGVEAAYDYFSNGSANFSNVAFGGAPGTTKITNIQQRAIELLGKVRYQFGNFEPYILAGAAYVQNGGFTETDSRPGNAAPNDSTTEKFTGKNYITAAYGAGVTYFIPSVPNLGIDAKWVGMLGRTETYKSDLGDTASIKTPTRNTVMVGLTYLF